MRWLGLVLLGPALWAVVFSVVYGLHGSLCAAASGPEDLGRAARLALVGAWLLGSAAFLPVFALIPARSGQAANLPRMGLWIGLVATLFTLFPVTVITSC